MRTTGISISRFVVRIGESYFGQRWPDGFHFTAHHVDLLIAMLRASQRFGIATGLDQRPNATVFRENNQPDSLHVRLHRFGGLSEMHLDKVSIVEGIDNAGQVIYVEDLARGFEHVHVDLIHRK